MGLLGFYFSPQGRIGRARFWLGIVGLLLIEGLFNYWLNNALFGHDWLDPKAGTLAKPALQLSLLINLIFLLPLFVVLAKRFHDRNKSAVWTLPFVIAYVAAIAGGVASTVQPAVAPTLLGGIGLVLLATTAWIVVELGCLKGNDGVNKYGVNPVSASQA